MLKELLTRMDRALGFPETRTAAYLQTLPTRNEQGLPRPGKEYIDYPSVHQTVYACIDVISAKASEIPIVVIRDKQIVDDHPLQKLLTNPNPIHTKVDLIRQLFQHLLADGNAYLEVVFGDGTVDAQELAQTLHVSYDHAQAILGAPHTTLQAMYTRICSLYAQRRLSSRNFEALLDAYSQIRVKKAKPVQLWPVVPTRVKIVPDPERFIRGYIFEGQGVRIPVQPEEVLHFKLPNPTNDYYGLSPLAAARLAVYTDIQAQKYQAQFFENSAIPGGLLIPDHAISPANMQHLRQQWLEMHRGVSSAHRVAVMPYGLKYQPIVISQADAQFIESMKLSRDQIREIYRVDDIMLGRGNMMTQNGADVARTAFYQDVLFPLLALVEEKINKQLAPLIDPQAKVKFNPFELPALLPVLRQKEEVARLRLANAWPVNLVFSTLHGMESPIKGPEGNLAYIPGNLIPLGVVSQSVAGPSPQKFPIEEPNTGDQDEVPEV